MHYRNRLMVAALAALIIHGGALRFLGNPYVQPPPRVEEPEPIVLNLQPDTASPPPRQLVDTAVPSQEPVSETDRISDANAQAMGPELQPGENAGPALEMGDADVLPVPAVASVPNPQHPIAPAPSESDETPKEEPLTPEDTEGGAQDPLDIMEADESILLARLEESAEESQDDSQAQTAAPPQGAPPELPEAGKSRTRGVDRIGQTNFEAIEDEMGPYLLRIRRMVQQSWLSVLLTKYSGTSPTEAEIYCAIAPDGKVISVSIVGAPQDRLFAYLCKYAIEQAGPFGAFTFEVPEMYRNKNLEIHWSFEFL